MKAVREYLNNVKPSFVGNGKYSNWFPLFDAIENLIFSYGKRTKNPIAKILRYFKPQTFRSKKTYTRKGRNASKQTKFFSLGDW